MSTFYSRYFSNMSLMDQFTNCKERNSDYIVNGWYVISHSNISKLELKKKKKKTMNPSI